MHRHGHFVGLVLGLWFGGCSLAQAQAQAQRTATDELRCGAALLRAQSVRLDFGVDAFPQLLRQTLSLTTASGRRLQIPVDGRAVYKAQTGRRRVLDAELSSWACLNQGQTPPYIVLFYSCTPGDERGDCAGSAKEWSRLLTVEGRNLTAGLQRHDRGMARVQRQQGLEQVLRDGVEATGLQR